MKSRAQSLPDLEPPSDLWPALAARLKSAPQVDMSSLQVIDLKSQRAGRRPWRVSLTVPQLAAAAIVLMVLSGSVVWLALGRTAGAGPALAGEPAVVRPVSSAPGQANDYTSAVESLEQALQLQRDRLDPVTSPLWKRICARSKQPLRKRRLRCARIRAICT